MKRLSERLIGLKTWSYETLCKGREMKAPGTDFSLTEIHRREPGCYLGWAPARLDERGVVQALAESICPGIVIMPRLAHAKYTEEKRFDRYNNIHRPQEAGQHLITDLLFSVYEPGIRLPGFVQSAGEKGSGLDMSKLLEGTEQGLLTLYNWMDDCITALIGQKAIPNTDLSVDEESITYSLYMDQSYVVDRRPIYYGFVTVDFVGIAREGTNPSYENLLK